MIKPYIVSFSWFTERRTTYLSIKWPPGLLLIKEYGEHALSFTL